MRVGGDRVGVPDVRGDGVQIRSDAAALEALLEVEDDDGGAAAAKGLGGRPPEARRAAGDERDGAVRVHAPSSSSARPTISFMISFVPP